MSKTLVFLRKFSSQKKIGYYTTPIYYVNAQPHIGHLYSSLIADAVQRWHKIKYKENAKISTGTDEHGTKIQQAAEKNKISLPKYCSEISGLYKNLSQHFDVRYTDFIRTTDENHKKCVQTFWKKLDENNHIYSSKYEGWYCVSDEAFLTESQLKEVIQSNGQKTFVSEESGHPVEWTDEHNYMFKLNAFKDDLKYWLTRNDNVVRPKKFQKILLDLILDDALPDVSISRPSSRVHWGIRVPGDDSQSIYVWLDALVNYLTVAGYPDGNNFKEIWPPDVQIIGKDILKFHGVYWPAFLMAAGLEPPKEILCHSHWTVDAEKMSKSKNNVVCPFDRSQIYTADGLRYFLLREGVAHSDGNYSDTKVIRILNSELADTLGNLLSRCCGKSLNPEQVFPAIEDRDVFNEVSSLDATKKLLDNLKALPGVCDGHFRDFNFYKVADAAVSTLHSANLFFETLKPWELRKRPDSQQKLNCVLHLAMEALRITGILLEPLIPNISGNLLNKIGVEEDKRYLSDARSLLMDADFKTRKLSPEKAVLFKRIVLEEKKKQEKKS